MCLLGMQDAESDDGKSAKKQTASKCRKQAASKPAQARPKSKQTQGARKPAGKAAAKKKAKVLGCIVPYMDHSKFDFASDAHRLHG